MQAVIEAARSKNLDRIAISYGAAAWIIVQAASIAAPAYAWPAWALQLIIVGALTGFPLALIGGWVVGVRAEAGSLRPTRADTQVLAVLCVLLIVASPIFALTFWPHASTTTAPPSGPPAAPPNSVAVLPFANMSGRPDQEYFSDGISEELLDHLSSTGVLRVASRTSSFAFKGRNVSVEEAARALHVRAILEGSVREAGNHLRIAVHLINAADGFELWSATYDRDLTNILAVQAEIATAITTALTSTLTGGTTARPQREAKVDPEAYRLILQAKELLHRGNEDDLTKAVALLRSATDRAPRYAPGYATLAVALRTLVDRYFRANLLDSAEIAARQAINLDPRNVPALGVLTNSLLDQWNWTAALDMFRQMETASPNSAEVLHQRSIMAYTFNYPAEDLAAELKAAELDPLAPKYQFDLALWYWNEKRYDEAAQAIRRARQLRQGKFQDVDMECLIETSRGRLDDARRLRDSISSYYAESPQNRMNCPVTLALAEGHASEARAMVDAAAADTDKNGGAFSSVADAYRLLGDLERTVHFYERAYDARDPLVMFAPYEKYQTPALLSYPPWKALWARQPIREWEAARIEAGRILGVKNSN